MTTQNDEIVVVERIEERPVVVRQDERYSVAFGQQGPPGTAIPFLPVATDDEPDRVLVEQDGQWVIATFSQLLDWLGITYRAVYAGPDRVMVGSDRVTAG